MPTVPKLARIGALLLLSTSGVPAGAVYTAEYTGWASSRAGASSSQTVAPFGSSSDDPPEMYYQAPLSSALVTGSTLLGANAGSGTSFSSASFTAVAGGLHVAVSATATAGASSGWSSGAATFSEAGAVAYDAFVLSSLRVAPGALLTVTASVSMTGSVGAMGFRNPSDGSGSFDALSSWHAQVQIANPTMMFPVHEQGSSACWDNLSVNMGCGGEGFSASGLTFTVANGQSTDLFLSARVRATATAGMYSEGLAGADAWADMGHTFAWGGISGVRDGSGNPVDQFSAFSATSGFDYRHAYVSAVPEPRAWWLFMIGALVLFFRARKGALA